MNTEKIVDVPSPISSTIPRRRISGYYDGSRLHVWMGDGTTDSQENIYYGYTDDFSTFTWNTTPVIPKQTNTGVRDPSLFVYNNTVYILIQAWRPNNSLVTDLWKVPVGSENNPASYVEVGVAIPVGGSGAFDDRWTASPSAVVVGDIVFVYYEAQQDTTWKYSIGLASQFLKDVEVVPYTKHGQILKLDNTVLENPTGATRAIVPDEPLRLHGSLFLPGHYYDAGTTSWKLIWLFSTGDMLRGFLMLRDASLNIGSDYRMDISGYFFKDQYMYFFVTGGSPEKPALCRIDLSDILS